MHPSSPMKIDNLARYVSSSALMLWDVSDSHIMTLTLQVEVVCQESENCVK